MCVIFSAFYLLTKKNNKIMKTAMQELINILESPEELVDRDLMKRLLEKEKEQIIEAYKEGWKNPSKFREHGSSSYYNSTFGDNLEGGI